MANQPLRLLSCRPLQRVGTLRLQYFRSPPDLRSHDQRDPHDDQLLPCVCGTCGQRKRTDSQTIVVSRLWTPLSARGSVCAGKVLTKCAWCSACLSATGNSHMLRTGRARPWPARPPKP